MKGSMKTSEIHKCLSTSEADSHSSIALELVLVEEELNIDIPCDLHTGGGTREPSSQGHSFFSLLVGSKIPSGCMTMIIMKLTDVCRT